MLTDNFIRVGNRVTRVNGKPAPVHLADLAIPPAWSGVTVNPDPHSNVWVSGFDAKGRRQNIYAKWHVADATQQKFLRVRSLLSQWQHIGTVIEQDARRQSHPCREEAIVALLIFLTGIRPGSNAETLADKKAFGATTLLLKHVKPSAVHGRCHLKFTGKKGVDQNIPVVHDFLAPLLILRKASTTSYTTPLFSVSAARVNRYISKFGDYTAKDFRTACGTSLALEILGSRKRIPKTASARRKIVNDALDKVARKLGNTRAVSRKSYVDPEILERFL